MHENKEFKIYSEILKYSDYVRKNVISTIPSVYRDLRIHLMDEIYYLKKNMLLAQNNKGNIRMKYITELIVNVGMLDIISDEIRNFCPDSKKKIEKSIYSLTKIRNMLYAWRQNPEGNEKRDT